MRLRIPLFLFALGASIFLSNLVGGNYKGFAYLIILVLLIVLFEKTKLSDKKVNIVYGILVALVGVALEILTEPGDYSLFFS